MLYYNHLLLAAAVAGSALGTKLPFDGGLHSFSDVVTRGVNTATATSIRAAVPEGVKLTGATRTMHTRQVGSLRGAGKGEGKGKGKGGGGKGGGGKGKGKGKGDDVQLGGMVYFTDSACTTPAAMWGGRVNHCLLAEDEAGNLWSMSTDVGSSDDFSLVENYWNNTNCAGDVFASVDIAAEMGLTELGTCMGGTMVDIIDGLPRDTTGLLIESYLDVDSCNSDENLVEIVFHFNGACFVDDGSTAIIVNTDNCASDGYAVVTEYPGPSCDSGGSQGQFPVAPCGGMLTDDGDDDGDDYYDDDEAPNPVANSQASQCISSSK